MTQAARAAQTAQAPPARRPPWAGPLVAGLAFGLAYGVTQRLVSLNVGELIRFGQGFDVQVFPGTSLDSLRLRFGAADAELRGDLELQQLKRQKAGSKAPGDTPDSADPTSEDKALDAEVDAALEPLPEEDAGTTRQPPSPNPAVPGPPPAAPPAR